MFGPIFGLGGTDVYLKPVTMKKLVLLLAPVIAFSLTGCNKEILFPDGDEDIYGQGGSSSGVTKPTTITVEQDEEDLIAGTSFTRTISITFSDNGGATVSGDENGIVKVSGNQVTVDNIFIFVVAGTHVEC